MFEPQLDIIDRVRPTAQEMNAAVELTILNAMP